MLIHPGGGPRMFSSFPEPDSASARFPALPGPLPKKPPSIPTTFAHTLPPPHSSIDQQHLHPSTVYPGHYAASSPFYHQSPYPYSYYPYPQHPPAFPIPKLENYLGGYPSPLPTPPTPQEPALANLNHNASQASPAASSETSFENLVSGGGRYQGSPATNPANGSSEAELGEVSAYPSFAFPSTSAYEFPCFSALSTASSMPSAYDPLKAPAASLPGPCAYTAASASSSTDKRQGAPNAFPFSGMGGLSAQSVSKISKPVMPQFEWMKHNSRPVGPGTNNVRVRTRDKYRMVYTDHQRLELEKEFYSNNYINSARKAELAQALLLTERQIKIWFQNRRAKDRKTKKRSGDCPGVGEGGSSQSEAEDPTHLPPHYPSL